MDSSLDQILFHSFQYIQQGDSGGPMIRASDGVQIGIVSLAPANCENPNNLISTFTSVARNLQWIRRTMGGSAMYQMGSATNRPETATGYYKHPNNKS